MISSDGGAIFSTPNRPVYSPGGSSLNPDHINELDQDEFRNLLLQHFSTVTIFGQGYKAEGMFEQRQRHQILSSGLAGRMLKRLGARQLLRRYRARFSNTKPFSDAYHEYRFALPLRDDSFVQIAICDGPRHFHIGCGKHKTQKN